MYWNETSPPPAHHDAAGRTTTVHRGRGRLAGAQRPLPPPPASWAAQAGSDVAVWIIELAPGRSGSLPAATNKEAGRVLYWYEGDGLSVETKAEQAQTALQLDSQHAVQLHNTGQQTAALLLLQGLPIDEPVARYGPFVMNTEAEIHQAISDYRRTQFGGWPWPESAPYTAPRPALCPSPRKNRG